MTYIKRPGDPLILSKHRMSSECVMSTIIIRRSSASLVHLKYYIAPHQNRAKLTRFAVVFGRRASGCETNQDVFFPCATRAADGRGNAAIPAARAAEPIRS